MLSIIPLPQGRGVKLVCVWNSCSCVLVCHSGQPRLSVDYCQHFYECKISEGERGGDEGEDEGE